MALRITNAVEVLPVPDGPQNKQALGLISTELFNNPLWPVQAYELGDG